MGLEQLPCAEAEGSGAYEHNRRNHCPKGRTGHDCSPTRTSSAIFRCCFRPIARSPPRSAKLRCSRPCARSRKPPTGLAKRRRTGGAQRRCDGRAPGPASRSRADQETPPFEPDLFASPTPADRRRLHAHEMQCGRRDSCRRHSIRRSGATWSNVGRGGCLVETARLVPANKALEIGLWVASGKIWVKGVVISGVSQHSTPSFGAARKVFASRAVGKGTPARVPQVCRGRVP